MVSTALNLLLEQAKENEHKAQLNLLAAKQELENYLLQLKQIENYRLEYAKKMLEQGQQGLRASSYGHLNRFILQLDETLAKQHSQVQSHEKNVEQTRLHWLQCREKTQSMKWLIEKRAEEEKKIANKNEQKQQDEFSSLSFFHRKK